MNNLHLFHEYFKTTPFFFLLNEGTRKEFYKRFTQYHSNVDSAGIATKEDRDHSAREEEPQAGLEKINELDLSLFPIELQHQFYENQTVHISNKYKWSSLSLEEKCRNNIAFNDKGLKTLPFY